MLPFSMKNRRGCCWLWRISLGWILLCIGGTKVEHGLCSPSDWWQISLVHSCRWYKGSLWVSVCMYTHCLFLSGPVDWVSWEENEEYCQALERSAKARESWGWQRKTTFHRPHRNEDIQVLDFACLRISAQQGTKRQGQCKPRSFVPGSGFWSMCCVAEASISEGMPPKRKSDIVNQMITSKYKIKVASLKKRWGRQRGCCCREGTLKTLLERDCRSLWRSESQIVLFSSSGWAANIFARRQNVTCLVSWSRSTLQLLKLTCSQGLANHRLSQWKRWKGERIGAERLHFA